MITTNFLWKVPICKKSAHLYSHKGERITIKPLEIILFLVSNWPQLKLQILRMWRKHEINRAFLRKMRLFETSESWENFDYLAIFLLVSSRQNFLSFSFLHFLCIFSEDNATFGKDISRPNRSFFLISFKKIKWKQRRLARILLHEKRRKRGKYAEK